MADPEYLAAMAAMQHQDRPAEPWETGSTVVFLASDLSLPHEGRMPVPERRAIMTLSKHAKKLLDGANFAHLATLQPDGAPKVEPVWVGREGDRVLVTSDVNTLKGRNLARDTRVALSIVADDNPYEQLLIRGRVVEVRPDDDLAFLDSLARRYIGSEFPRRRWKQRAIYVIEPRVARHYVSPLVHNPTPVSS